MVEYDKDQLRDAIFKVLTDEELRRRFGEGVGGWWRKFDWDKVVLEIEKIYLNLIPMKS